MKLTIPTAVADKLNALDALVDQYPVQIPVKACAEFLSIGQDSLRRSIETGNCPFALGWQKAGAANRAFCVPTVPFYLWYTQCAVFKGENDER